ncbi:beta-lactamase [Pseudomonas sp. GM41(2012)]|nr:beta-lactamase [Pseudomonas sp. GM41(2012)]
MVGDQFGVLTQTQAPGWGFGYGWAVLAEANQSDSPLGQGTLQWGGVCGHSWLLHPVSKLTVVSLTNTAFEGISEAFSLAVRNAVYGHTEP